MHQEITVTFTYLDQTHTFPLPATYKVLVEKCEKILEININTSMDFYCNDQEGDNICIASDYDFKQTIDHLKKSNNRNLILSLVHDVQKTIDLFNDQKRKCITFNALKRITKINKHFIRLLSNRIKEVYIRIKTYDFKQNQLIKRSAVYDDNDNDNDHDSDSTLKTNNYACTRSDTEENKSPLAMNDYTYNELEKELSFLLNSIKIDSKCNQLKHSLIKTGKDIYHKNNMLISFSSKDNNHMNNTMNMSIISNSRSPENNTIHSNIICSQCQISPIQGIRYQCSTCPNINLCSNCENITDHCHKFYKIRNHKPYSYQCLNKLLTYQIPQAKTNYSVHILLKNTGSISWDNNTIVKFVCDKPNSDVIPSKIIATEACEVLPEEEIMFTIIFMNINQLSAGIYASRIYFTVKNITYGQPIVIKLNIHSNFKGNIS